MLHARGAIAIDIAFKKKMADIPQEAARLVALLTDSSPAARAEAYSALEAVGLRIGDTQQVRSVARAGLRESWGDNSVSRSTAGAVGLTVEPKVLALVRTHLLWRFPYMKRVHGVLDGVGSGVLWDPAATP
jgi:hypothetical protein